MTTTTTDLAVAEPTPSAPADHVPADVRRNLEVQPRSLVRIVRAIGPGKQVADFALVLTRALQDPETIGANGEQSLTIAYMDPMASPSILGSGSWHQALIRVPNVAHHTHPDVLAGKRGVYWVDAVSADTAEEGLPEDLPEIPHGGTSAVLSRQNAMGFFDQPSKTVPLKVEPVKEGAPAGTQGRIVGPAADPTHSFQKAGPYAGAPSGPEHAPVPEAGSLASPDSAPNLPGASYPPGQVPMETKNYSDGTSATGPVPMPDLSPAQQGLEAGARLREGFPGRETDPTSSTPASISSTSNESAGWVPATESEPAHVPLTPQPEVEPTEPSAPVPTH